MSLPVITPAGFGRCASCEHWERDSYPDDAGRVGCCLLITTNTDLEGPAAMVDDDQAPDFVTTEDFGCVLWEAMS